MRDAIEAMSSSGVCSKGGSSAIVELAEASAERGLCESASQSALQGFKGVLMEFEVGWDESWCR